MKCVYSTVIVTHHFTSLVSETHHCTICLFPAVCVLHLHLWQPSWHSHNWTVIIVTGHMTRTNHRTHHCKSDLNSICKPLQNSSRVSSLVFMIITKVTGEFWPTWLSTNCSECINVVHVLRFVLMFVCFSRTWSSIRRLCWTPAVTFHLSTTSSSGSESVCC